MDVGDEKKGSSGINFTSMPLANLKNVALLQKCGLLFTHNLWVIHVKTLCGILNNFNKLHMLRKAAKDQGNNDACVELVYLNLISSRCLQDSVNDRWLNDPDFCGYQGLSPVLALSARNLDNRDYSWNRL